MRILVLGHAGMLGNAVEKHFSRSSEHTVLTISARWPSESFKQAIAESSAEVIINCIGKIPQHNPSVGDYEEVNVALPVFLDTLGVRVVHPSTDCEFSGTLPPGERYQKDSLRDADDPYGKSKGDVSALIESSFQNTKILRTSIIGHEKDSHVSLLDWFLAQEDSVRGYTNHYWNGITTLEWAKQCAAVLERWDSFPVLTQLGTEDCASKYEVLKNIARVYEKNIEILPVSVEVTVNKCLVPDYALPALSDQLAELRTFYGR